MLTVQIGNVAVETKCDYFLSLKNTIRSEKGKIRTRHPQSQLYMHTHTHTRIYIHTYVCINVCSLDSRRVAVADTLIHLHTRCCWDGN